MAPFGGDAGAGPLVRQQDFEAAAFGGAGEGLVGLGERKTIGDEGAHVDFAAGEELERGGEATAAGADERDLIDDDGGHVEGDGFGDGGLHDNASAGAGHGDGGGEAGRGAGGIDGDVEGAGAASDDAAAFGDGNFGGVAAEEVDLGAAGLEHLGDEEAEFAIAENGDALGAQAAELLLDLAGGGDGFDEDGFFVREGRGDGEEVRFGEREILGEGAGVLDDAEDGTGGAVAFEAFLAGGAGVAGEVDFADDTLADPGGGVRFFDDADELMAGATGEAVVSAEEFEIGVADAGEGEADAGVAAGSAGLRDLMDLDALVFEMDG